MMIEVSEDTMSSDDSKFNDSGSVLKQKPKKRSLIERELETSLTPQFISPVNNEGQSTSRYGRARRHKTDNDYWDTNIAVSNALRSPKLHSKTPIKQQSPAYKMHALNSPVRSEANFTSDQNSNENNLDNQIENICNANLSLSRFGQENKKVSPSPSKKLYSRKDIIQSKEKDDPVLLIKNMFSPAKREEKHLNPMYNGRSSEKKHTKNTNIHSKQNGHISIPSVVKTLDFDSSKKKKKEGDSKIVLSKSDVFELEAKCGFQVGGLAWARMGTFPFWPCIVTREPGSDLFVKKKLFGRIERNMIHVTFFGDNGRRSWILDSMLRPFQGKAEFESAREQYTQEAKKRDPRLYAAFFISEKKQPLWNFSVDEAETLFKEPKRLRIDLLYDMLEKSRSSKHAQKNQKSEKICRTDSDVSLSESLYDSLFSEEDVKSDETDKRTRSNRKSLDVSEVVTACLDNMAAKTGMTVIQKQSHMDRWLQKAKSKTPEKLQLKVPGSLESIEVEKKEIVIEKSKETKTNDRKKKKKDFTKSVPSNKPYSLRRSMGESQILMSYHNEHDYSKSDKSIKVPGVLEVTNNDICVIEKVESIPDQNSNNDLISKLRGQDKNKTDMNEILQNHDEKKLKLNKTAENSKESNVLIDIEDKMDVDEHISLKNNLSISIEVQSVDEKIEDSPNGFDIIENDCQNTVENKDSKICDLSRENTDNLLNDDNKTDSSESIEIPKESDKTKILISRNEELSNGFDIIENGCQNTVENKESKICDLSRENTDNLLNDDNKTDSSESIEIPKESDKTKILISRNEELSNHVNAETNIESNNQGVTDSLKSDTSVEDNHIKENETHISESNMSIDNIELSAEDNKDNKTNEDLIEEKANLDSIGEPDTVEVVNLKNNEEVISTDSETFKLFYDVSPIKNNKDAKKVEVDKINATPLNVEIEKAYNDNSDKVNCNKVQITPTLVKDKVEITKIDTTNEITDQEEAKLSSPGTDTIEDIDLNSRKYLEANCKELRVCLTPLKDNVMNDHLSKATVRSIETSITPLFENGIERTECTDTNNHTDKNEPDCNEMSDNIKSAESNNEKLENLPLENCVNSKLDTEITTVLSETLKSVNKNEKFEEKSNIKKNSHLSNEINPINTLNSEIDAIPNIEDVDLNNQNKDIIEDKMAAENTDDMLKAIKTIDILMTEFDSETTSLTSSITEVSSPIKMPVDILNSLRESDVMKRIKNELLLDSDTESASSELDNINLKELKATLSKNRNNEAFKTNDISSKSKGHKVVNDGGDVSEISDIGSKTENNYKKHSLRLRRSQSPTDSVKTNDFLDSKESSPDRKVKKEIDPDTISINSEDSTASSLRRRGRREKQKDKDIDRSQDPEFLRYLEMRQDNLIDEHPELTLEEIVAYLYKTWLYEENLKPDIKKSDDIDQMTLVKGVNEELQPKRAKKKGKTERKKLIDMDKVLDKEMIIDLDALPKDKPKRKTVQSCYYKEDFSDVEDEIQLFEIFKKQKPVQSTQEAIKSPESAKADPLKSPISVKVETEIETIGNNLIPEEYDDEEKYFEQIAKPKPNVFKGLVREKVCEICEKTSNLIKCKGCNGMFHVECSKKETEVVEVAGPTRGRKKKKKPRGRKPKSLDSNGLDESHSDEKSQDTIDENDVNMSIDEIKEPESIVVDIDNFEAQMEAKMKELLDKVEHIDYDSYSSDDGIDWSETIAGKCEIVDVKLKPKHTESIDYADFKCKSCQTHDVPICFVCKSAVSPKTQINVRQRCQVAHCHKHYHLECLEQWPQTHFNAGEPSKNNKKINEHFEALTCPRHVCHTCVCDDPRGCKTRFSGDKLARCVRCPATYHTFTKCLPAGTQILTASHIICPRHYQHRPGKVPYHVNTGWCFICALGGTLICCEYCPTSFHAECLNIDPPAGGYMCEDCETGRLPLYGEMVWVKLGHYRWWPGIILHPSEIPANIMAVKHSLGEFVVRFFGQYDHYWVNRGRVFPFQEGDSGKISSQKSKIDEAFTKAIEHAQRAFEILKNTEPNQLESLDIASSLLPPHYVKLKVNKPCGAVCGRRDPAASSLPQCECGPREEDPCGPHSHCLNRMLLTECGPNCRTGERCNNRAFEKRLYPKLVPYRTPHRGWGLKTLEDIRAGQFVIEYVGELIDEEEFRRRMRRKHEIRDENFYFLTLDKERMIDAGPKGNLARFMNHCCEPNCETQKWTVLGDVRVGLFAINDIPANTEVNFNYNLECAGIDKKRCLCGAKRCSGYMGAKPKQDEPQLKKPKIAAKRTYKKRKNTESSPSTVNKIKRPVGRPAKPRELTEIEKDLLIIKNATNGISSDSEGSGRLSSIDDEKNRPLKRKRVEFSSEDPIESTSIVKKLKIDEEKSSEVVLTNVAES